MMEKLSANEFDINYSIIIDKIIKATEKSGRKPEDIILLAATKTVDAETINYAISKGIGYIGENKVQELVDKYEVMPKDIRWHMIGHLQRNKVKYIIDKVYLIHSVDSLRLAEEISKEAIKKAVDVNILIEVNVAEEESKFGFKVDEVLSAVETIATFSHVRIKGLMTIAPFVENPEENRSIFARLHKLSVDIRSKNIDNVSVDILSMGMTNDYQVAIEEGATMIRVGTGIFGEREYHI